MKISGKFILKVAGTLTVISLITAALLGATNKLTADKIAAINEENTKAAIAAVLPSANAQTETIEVSDAVYAAASAHSGKVTEAYAVTIDGAAAGYAFKVVAGGSQGDIEMIVGVDADLAVTGISVVDHSETSGIGTKVVGNEPTASGVGVLDQFIGKSGAGSLVVKSNIDAISGATVSSKGVTKGVNAALAAAEAMG